MDRQVLLNIHKFLLLLSFFAIHRSFLPALSCQAPALDATPRCSYDPKQTRSTTRDLKRCLLSDYDRLCPPNGSANVTEVSIIVLPINLIHVDDKAQQLNLHVYFALRWFDRRLAWSSNISESSIETTKELNSAGNSSAALEQRRRAQQQRRQQMLREAAMYYQLYFESDSLWLPHIIIRERLYTTQESYFLKEVNLRVRQDGAITLYGYFVDKWACRMSTRLFPFDYQRCNLTLVTSQQVNLTYVDLYAKAKGDASLFDSYINAGYDMGEWTLDIRAARGKLHQWSRYVQQWECTFFIYELGLLRDPMQHVLTWIIPPVITSLGAVLGLYLGCDPSERYSFGSAIVIALILMMIGLNDRLPVSDDGYPVLGMLYFSLCLIVIIASFLSTIPSNVRQRLLHKQRKHQRSEAKQHQPDSGSGDVENFGEEKVRRNRQSLQRRRSSVFHRFADKKRSAFTMYLLHGNNLDVILMSINLTMEIVVIVMSTLQWMESKRS